MSELTAPNAKMAAMCAAAMVGSYAAYTLVKKKAPSPPKTNYTLMDGNAVKKAVIAELQEEVAAMQKEHGIVPGLAVSGRGQRRGRVGQIEERQGECGGLCVGVGGGDSGCDRWTRGGIGARSFTES